MKLALIILSLVVITQIYVIKRNVDALASVRGRATQAEFAEQKLLEELKQARSEQAEIRKAAEDEIAETCERNTTRRQQTLDVANRALTTAQNIIEKQNQLIKDTVAENERLRKELKKSGVLVQ